MRDRMHLRHCFASRFGGLCRAGVMEAVTFGNNLPGFEIGEKEVPAVVVVQEWWGINKIIKDAAEKVHRLGGYRVLLPDLYKGKIVLQLMMNLGWENGVEEMKHAVQYLRETGSRRVGVVGFCMGGALALCAAEHAGVDCAVAFYGIPPPSSCDPTLIKIPVQCHFGKLDTLVGMSDPKTAGILEESMKAANVPCEFFHYDGAGHAFMNEGKEAIESRDMMGFPHPPDEAREEAWKRLMHFFTEHLRMHT